MSILTQAQEDIIEELFDDLSMQDLMIEVAEHIREYGPDSANKFLQKEAPDYDLTEEEIDAIFAKAEIYECDLEEEEY